MSGYGGVCDNGLYVLAEFGQGNVLGRDGVEVTVVDAEPDCLDC